MKRFLIIFLLVGFWSSSRCQSEILSEDQRYSLDVTVYNGQGLDSLVSKITGVVSGSELTKVYAVSYWIAKHIRYDNEGLRNGFWHRLNFDTTIASIVLEQGKAICGGYAMLGKAMFDRLDLINAVITGTAKGRNYNDTNTNENHAWNVVKIDSIWHLFDMTWASPKNDHEKVNEFYLDSHPERLISTHYPTDQKWCLLDYNISKEQFRNMPRISADFYEFGLGKSIPNIKVDTNTVSIELSNGFVGEVGFILHEEGTYNSDIVEHSETETDKSKIVQIPVPNNGKIYKIEMTYISRNPMLKHFALLTLEIGKPADNK